MVEVIEKKEAMIAQSLEKAEMLIKGGFTKTGSKVR